MLAEQLVRDYAPQLFPGRKPAGRAIIRVTRSADISPDDGSVPDGESYRERVRQVLEQRPRLGAVRLEIQGKMKMPVVKQLCAGLGLSKDQVFWSRCPLSLGYVWQLADCLSGFPALFYPDFTPRVPAEFPAGQPVAALVQERGRLLHYPYESMEPFLRLLEESAHDPAVTSVCLTVYRVAKQSRVLSCLLEAARNGKAVTVAFELRARFDEQNNIDWAERLEAAGCRVVYGIPKIKCHAKLCLIHAACTSNSVIDDPDGIISKTGAVVERHSDSHQQDPECCGKNAFSCNFSLFHKLFELRYLDFTKIFPLAAGV